MKTLICMTLWVVLGSSPGMGQSGSPAADKVPEKAWPVRSIGVLIGLSRRYDSQVAGSGLSPSLEDKKSAAYERQRSPDTDNASDRPVRYDTTAEESPYITVWVRCSPAGTQVRLLRDIILPRKDGFWRFGKNYSSVKEGQGTMIRISSGSHRSARLPSWPRPNRARG